MLYPFEPHTYFHIFIHSFIHLYFHYCYSCIACLGSYWLGVKDTGQNGIWKWASDWSTAGIYIRKVSALTFYNAQPDNWQNNEHCLYLIYGYVNDVDCPATFVRCLCDKPGIELLLSNFRGWMWIFFLFAIQGIVQIHRRGGEKHVLLNLHLKILTIWDLVIKNCITVMTLLHIPPIPY